jgi:hypothetical protein
MNIVPHIQKGARYTIGTRIENKFLDLLELGYDAYFTSKDQKEGKISECIFLTDVLKFLISIAWEGKILSHKQFEEVAFKLEEIGKILGGWRNNLNGKKNSRALEEND